MKSRIMMSALFCFLLLISAAYAFSSPVSQQDAVKKQVQQWDHLAMQHDGVDLGGDLSTQINRLGDKGWQMVTVSTIAVDGTSKRTIYYFKRPK